MMAPPGSRHHSWPLPAALVVLALVLTACTYLKRLNSEPAYAKVATYNNSSAAIASDGGGAALLEAKEPVPAPWNGTWPVSRCEQVLTLVTFIRHVADWRNCRIAVEQQLTQRSGDKPGKGTDLPVLNLSCKLCMRCRFLSCGDGSWQREYAQLHRDIIASRSEPRFLLALGENGGHLSTFKSTIKQLCRCSCARRSGHRHCSTASPTA
jgi:hypothetical protein